MSRRTVTVTETAPALQADGYPSHRYNDHVEICASQHIPTPVFQEIAVESAYWTGAVYGLLLEFADPNVAFGSHAHSSAMQRPFSRLHRSLLYISAHIYGSPEDVATIAGTINRQHKFIRGAKYNANDPESQRWVAATIFHSYVVVHEALFGKMPRSMREALCLEGVVFGVNLSMPKEMWFKSIDEYDEYLEHKLATLEVTKQGRELAQFALYGVGIAWYLPYMLCLVFFLNRAVVTTWLPPRLRKDFGLPDPNSWLIWLTYNFFIHVLGTMYILTPRFIRQMPTKWLRSTIKHVAADIRRTGRWPI
ncbi:hypothetical protein PT974_11517 [Cladobotryum mycophilum]|uniref:ER-bound oxygenase mpaB/mpaB'/Rubber oxygenase catalytic domain-containing protein n=1 Tax=Cladobotryum mycophilum TaxID=491253 RepID=A0ABR0S6G6_9HYPO